METHDGRPELHPLVLAWLRVRLRERQPPGEIPSFMTLLHVSALLRVEAPATDGDPDRLPVRALPLVEALVLDVAELRQLLLVAAPPARVALVGQRLSRTLAALATAAPPR